MNKNLILNLLDVLNSSQLETVASAMTVDELKASIRYATEFNGYSDYSYANQVSVLQRHLINRCYDALVALGQQFGDGALEASITRYIDNANNVKEGYESVEDIPDDTDDTNGYSYIKVTN